MEMKNLSKYLLIGALVIYGLLITQRSCGLGEKYYTLKTEHDILAGQVVKDKAEADKRIADLIAVDVEKDKQIAVLNATIAVKNSSIKILHEKTAKLEVEFALYATLHDKDAQIVNLQEQVNVWKQKFDLAESTIADKDGIIFSLTEKYDAQVKISAEWKGSYEREHQLRLVSEKLYEEIKGKYRGINLLGGIKTAAILLLGGLVVYGALT